jgi:hypothetical protein
MKLNLPDARVIAAKALPHLEGWRVVGGQPDVPERVIVESPMGERVAILGYVYEHKDRLVATGTIPVGVGHKPVCVGWDKVPVVTVAKSRGPQALAHAIESRLMSKFRPLWAKWQRKATESIIRDAASVDLEEQLKGMVGRHHTGRLHVTSPDHVEWRLMLTAAEAVAVAQVLGKVAA